MLLLAVIIVILASFGLMAYTLRLDTKPGAAKTGSKEVLALMEVDALLAKIEYETTDLVARGYATEARQVAAKTLLRAIEGK